MPSDLSSSALLDPVLDLGRVPDLAHGEHDDGLREVVAADELLDALAADAEALGDLGAADEVVHGVDHRHETTRHLTRGPAQGHTSHMTRTRAYDLRERCDKGHLCCDDCTRCACDVDVSGRVTTDRDDATLCPDCRYDRGLPL